MRDIRTSEAVTATPGRFPPRDMRDAGCPEPAESAAAMWRPVFRNTPTSAESILARLLELTRISFQIGRKD